MTRYKIEDCKGVTELCSGPGYMKNWYDKEWFTTYMEKAFEDCMMPLPVGYDAYLRTVFGDYMELPPEKTGWLTTTAYFWIFMNLYTKYRGIYYLTKEAEDGNKRVTK